jgi:K(+)-stimulated pyrophosphate-energized sodium pump
LVSIAIVLLGKLVYADNQLIAEMLGGYMAGVTVSGALGGIPNNAGGAWDNAKNHLKLEY